MTSEQKMIQYLRHSMQKLKQTHREKEELIRVQAEVDRQAYQRTEDILMTKIRVQSILIEQLKDKLNDTASK